MSIVSTINDRPLPSFKQWLEEHSPDTKAPDFADFEDLARRTQDQCFNNLKPNEASFGRMWMGACVAAIELCNMEALKYDRPPHEIVATLPRVFATATMYAIASICKDDSPFRDIAKIVTEEFRAAAKTAADTLAASSDADG